jgi:hypothetical protein
MEIANEWNPSPSLSNGESPIKTSFGNIVSDPKRVRMEGQSRKGRIKWGGKGSVISKFKCCTVESDVFAVPI